MGIIIPILNGKKFKKGEFFMKSLLIETDGYSIDVTEFDSKEDAINAMKKRYTDLTPADNDNPQPKCLI